MVNSPNSIPPPGSGPSGPESAQQKAMDKIPTGNFHFSKGRKFGGMEFSAKEWGQFMNSLVTNLNNYIKKTMQKMTEKMKEDWKKSQE